MICLWKKTTLFTGTTGLCIEKKLFKDVCLVVIHINVNVAMTEKEAKLELCCQLVFCWVLACLYFLCGKMCESNLWPFSVYRVHLEHPYTVECCMYFLSRLEVGWYLESDNTGQQRFCPMRKKVWCIFGRRIQIFFPPTPFALRQTMKAQSYICESLGAYSW
jgi:hypothetical protein